MRIPRDVAAMGLVMEAEHVPVVGEVIRQVKNKTCITMLSVWRQSVERLPFIVLAGQFQYPDQGAVGGMAESWEHAMRLVDLALRRMNEMGYESPQGFSSVWVLLVSPARQAEVQALIAQRQETGGSA